MSEKFAIGLMSGTSLDGIDGALIKIKNNHYQIIETISLDYEEEERKLLFEACSVEDATNELICSLNMYLGEKFSEAVTALLNKANLKNEDIAFISSHGQTIYHIPEKTAPSIVPSTLQIGDLSMLSEKTGIGVVGDFRTADMAAGGQGAPLTSFADKILFTDEKKYRAVQNIGGIGNVTYVPPAHANEDVIAFDTGPGNMMIDEVVLQKTNGAQTYDKDGAIARSGQIDETLLEELMTEPYISQVPPKTTGRELFGKQYVSKLLEKHAHLPFETLVCTVTEFTALSITYHYKKFLHKLDEVIIGGGGSYNAYLVERIQAHLAEVPVYTHEAFNISSDFKEALAFVILGHHFLLGKYNMIPSATGAAHPVLLGKMAATTPDSLERLFQVREE